VYIIDYKHSTIPADLHWPPPVATVVDPDDAHTVRQPKWLFVAAFVVATLCGCFASRNWMKNFALRLKVEHQTNEVDRYLPHLNRTVGALLKPSLTERAHFAWNESALRQLGREWQQLEVRLLNAPQQPGWRSLCARALGALSHPDEREVAAAKRQVRDAVVNELNDLVRSGVRNASAATGRWLAAKRGTLLFPRYPPFRIIVGHGRPGATEKSLWVKLLQMKAAAYVRDFEGPLVRNVFNDYECERLLKSRGLLTVRIHKHYSPTQKKVENFLRTYKDDDIWHEVDEAIVAELNDMFDGFCTSQPTCAGSLLDHPNIGTKYALTRLVFVQTRRMQRVTQP
jgi:hypothetical protein